MIEGIEGMENVDKQLDRIRANELVKRYAIEKSTRTCNLPLGSITLDTVVIPADVQKIMDPEDLSVIARFHDINEQAVRPPTMETMSDSSVDLFSTG